MTMITLPIPDDIHANLAADPNGPSRALRLAAAFSLCQQGKLSTSQAARLAELTYTAFLDVSRRGRKRQGRAVSYHLG